MKQNNIYFLIFILILYFNAVFGQTNNLFIPKMTAINPVSLTDVIFLGQRDTVLVSRYNGTISKKINGIKTEKTIAKINDEIYLISYNSKKKHIAASTLENGIVIINELNGKIITKLPLIQTWTLRMDYSDDGKYIFANDQRGNRFMWDVEKNYKPMTFPKEFPAGTIYAVQKNIITLVTSKQIVKWDYEKEAIQDTIATSIIKLGDIDSLNNVLSLNFNIAEFIDAKQEKKLFSVMHPSMLRPVESMGGEDAARTQGLKLQDGYFEDPHYQMALTTAKFAKNKIYTASIDRSIRVWDKNNGQLLDSYTGHKATINKLKISKDESQIVSIDLLGGIKFWNTK